MLYAAISNLVVESVPTERTSEANGMVQLARTVGTAIGAQITSVLLATHLVADPVRPGVNHPSSQAYLLTMGAIALLSALCALAALALPRRRTRAAARVPTERTA
jgi:MFS family permease